MFNHARKEANSMKIEDGKKIKKDVSFHKLHEPNISEGGSNEQELWQYLSRGNSQAQVPEYLYIRTSWILEIDMFEFYITPHMA